MILHVFNYVSKIQCVFYVSCDDGAHIIPAVRIGAVNRFHNSLLIN